MNRISDLERRYVEQVLANDFSSSTNSVFNSRLEVAFAEKFNTRFAIAQVNGTTTLHTALVALGIGGQDEVIVPPLTMSSPAISVLQAGAIPVFSDVDPQTFTLCPKAIEKNITTKTKAVMTVSLYGLSPDYDAISTLCKKHGLFLIEDNAQCFLGEYKGKLVGQFGDFSSYSFQASKHMTAGEGGILTTNDPDLAEKARKFSSLGYAGITSTNRKITKEDIQNPNYDRHVSLGFNYRMSELAAAVALAQLEKLEELVQNHIRCAKILNEVISHSGVLIPQQEPEGYVNSFWTYGALLKTPNPERDWLRFREIHLRNAGDGYYAAWKLSYFEPLFQKSKYQNWQSFKPGLCPNAEYLQPRMLQFKTNYWNLSDATKEAEILEKTIRDYKREL